MKKLKRDNKVFQALMVEREVRWMFKKMVPKGMTNTALLMELMEMYRAKV